MPNDTNVTVNTPEPTQTPAPSSTPATEGGDVNINVDAPATGGKE